MVSGMRYLILCILSILYSMVLQAMEDTKTVATQEVFDRFYHAVSNDYTQEVEDTLKHTQFSQQQLAKALGNAGIGTAAVLLHCGAQVNIPIDRDTAGRNIVADDVTPLYNVVYRRNLVLTRWYLIFGGDPTIKFPKKQQHKHPMALRKPFKIMYSKSPLEIAEERAQEKFAGTEEKQILEFLKMPRECFQNPELKKEITIKNDTVERAMWHSNCNALHLLLKNYTETQTEEKQNKLNEWLKTATALENITAMRILINFGANASTLFKSARLGNIPFALNDYPLAITREVIKRKYVSSNEVANGFLNRARKARKLEKSSTMINLKAHAHIILEHETGEHNITKALQHRAMGLAKRQKTITYE